MAIRSMARIRPGRRAVLGLLAGAALTVSLVAPLPAAAAAGAETGGPALLVDPLVGSAHGGNTFPGADTPFGMVQWSPETTRGNAIRTPAPGGYAFDATRIRGFSLTHMSGPGCAGAYGDVPFMPIAGPVTSSPSADTTDAVYASSFSHANEQAGAGAYRVQLDSGVTAELTATPRTGSGRFTFPAGQPATMLVRVSSSEVGSSDAQVSVDPRTRTISGSVTSGNFCGHIPDGAGNRGDRGSSYTLHFVAEVRRP